MGTVSSRCKPYKRRGPSPQGQERDHITDDDEENGGKENEETFLGKVCNNGME